MYVHVYTEYVNMLIWSVTTRGIATYTFMIAEVKWIAIDTGGIVVAIQYQQCGVF